MSRMGCAPWGGRTQRRHLSLYFVWAPTGWFSQVASWTPHRYGACVIHHVYRRRERRLKDQEDYVGVLDILLLPGGGPLAWITWNRKSLLAPPASFSLAPPVSIWCSTVLYLHCRVPWWKMLSYLCMSHDYIHDLCKWVKMKNKILLHFITFLSSNFISLKVTL